MDIVDTKIVVALLFGLIRFLSGILPIKLHQWLKISSDNGKELEINEARREVLENIVAIIQSFGGGVLFATCFLHMMPEVSHLVAEMKKFGVLQNNYPYSQLVISLGFFTIYFSEELSQWLISRTPKIPYKKQHINKVTSGSGNSDKIYVESPYLTNRMAFEVLSIDTLEKNRINQDKDFLDNFSVDLVVDTADEGVQTENAQQLENVQKMEANLEFDTDVNAEIEEFIEEEGKTQQQVLRCFLMVMALSLHAFFEGLAIGLQRSVKNIWYLFTAVSIHSATILFVIGSDVVMAGTTAKTTVIHMSMLSSTSPFGVLLGLIATLTTNLETSGKSFAIVLLEGLSAGTILYITFFETLTREKERKKCRKTRATFIAAGFTLMAVLQIFVLTD